MQSSLTHHLVLLSTIPILSLHTNSWTDTYCSHYPFHLSRGKKSSPHAFAVEQRKEHYKNAQSTTRMLYIHCKIKKSSKWKPLRFPINALNQIIHQTLIPAERFIADWLILLFITFCDQPCTLTDRRGQAGRLHPKDRGLSSLLARRWTRRVEGRGF